MYQPSVSLTNGFELLLSSSADSTISAIKVQAKNFCSYCIPRFCNYGTCQLDQCHVGALTFNL